MKRSWCTRRPEVLCSFSLKQLRVVGGYHIRRAVFEIRGKKVGRRAVFKAMAGKDQKPVSVLLCQP